MGDSVTAVLGFTAFVLMVLGILSILGGLFMIWKHGGHNSASGRRLMSCGAVMAIVAFFLPLIATVLAADESSERGLAGIVVLIGSVAIVDVLWARRSRQKID